VERYLENNKGFVVPSVPLEHFVLYCSVAVDGVPQYREVATNPLIHAEPIIMRPEIA
jgi:hypothetical protein